MKTKIIKRITSAALVFAMVLSCAMSADMESLMAELTGTYAYASSSSSVNKISGLKVSTSASKAALSWNKISGVNGYKIYKYNTKSRKYDELAAVKTNKYTVSKLSACKTYKFMVKAYKKVNDKTIYGKYAVVTARTKLKPVTGLKSTALNKTSLCLSWNKVSGVQGYAVYKYSSNKWVKLKKLSGNQYTVNGLKAGVTYKFAVKGYKKSGSSYDYTSTANISACPKLNAVSNLKASAVTYDSVKLSWNKISGAAKYYVYKYNSAKKKYEYVASTTALYYKAGNLKVGTSYKFAVMAAKTLSGSTVKSDRLSSINVKTKTYYKFNAKQKEVFNQIRSGILNMKTTINISSVLNKNDYGSMMAAVTYSLPQVSNLSVRSSYIYDDNNCIFQVYPEYTCSKTTEEKRRTAQNNIINSIAAKTKNMSQYDKVKYFHDYIINKCSYTASGNNIFSAYGCLVEGQAVCQGYSNAFNLLCTKAGIACINITGNAVNPNGETENHMWNMVKVNGRWYHIDVTWDDQSALDGYISYDFFLTDSASILKGRNIFTTKFISYPSAVSNVDNYFVKNKLYVDDNQSYKKVFDYTADKTVKNKQKYIMIRFKNQKDYVSFVNNIKSSYVFDVLKSKKSKYKSSLDCNNIKYCTNSNMLTVTIKLTY
ncbi:MAG: fibronectin type III domain-containing protein [Oscillospiraceae bacterium]